MNVPFKKAHDGYTAGGNILIRQQRQQEMMARMTAGLMINDDYGAIGGAGGIDGLAGKSQRSGEHTLAL